MDMYIKCICGIIICDWNNVTCYDKYTVLSFSPSLISIKCKHMDLFSSITKK